MKNRNRGIIEMLICAALWSSAGILIKLLPWNGFAVASIRSLIAGLTILIYALATGRRMIINRKTLLAGMLTAGVYTCFSVANKLTTAANAIVLQFTETRFPYVTSKPIHKSQTILSKSECTISLEVKPTRELEQQILSFGPDVEVLSPDAFRNQIGKKITEMMKKHFPVQDDRTEVI